MRKKYQAQKHYFGTISLEYVAFDGIGGSAIGSATLNIASVNDAPVLVGHSFNTNEDHALTIEPAALLSGATDIDGDTLRISSVQAATHGTVVLTDEGKVQFTPEANYHGGASFTYTATNAAGVEEDGLVKIVVHKIGEKPDTPAVEDSEGFVRDDSALVGAWRSKLINAKRNDEGYKEEGYRIIAVDGKAIERYIVYPGQATAYTIGKLKIMELREKARAELGSEFDIRGFHDTILKSGPVPLSILEKMVDNWIASVKAENT